jgi:hypothetical protein
VQPNSISNNGDPQALPSVDDAKPNEEGGPIARAGFTYQDEIAVGFLLEMLENRALLRVHCETHDDVVLVREVDGFTIKVAEFVQVKAGEPDKLWSVADICARKNGAEGTSIFEISLARDKYSEMSRFRLVTLRPVVSELKMLTFPLEAPGREATGDRYTTVLNELDRRFPGLKSRKNNGAAYWLANCFWDECHTEKVVRDRNLLRLVRLSINEKLPLLPEQAEVLLDELRAQAKAAGEARWEPDRNKKIFARDVLRQWWESRKHEVAEGAAAVSGGKLRTKMTEAGLPNDIIELAVELRRDYAASARTPRYMEPDEGKRLQSRVKAEVMSLRSGFVAGRLNMDAASFHDLCLEKMNSINNELSSNSEDQSAFLKGCMYDIADRCLLRFDRTAR